MELDKAVIVSWYHMALSLSTQQEVETIPDRTSMMARGRPMGRAAKNRAVARGDNLAPSQVSY